MRFTEIGLKALPLTESGQKRYRDETLPGFGITVGKRTKTFFVMYGQDRRVETLGQFPEKSLRDARKEAKGILALHSPKKRSTSLTAARTAFLADCRTRLRPTTVERYANCLIHYDAPTLDRVTTNVTDPNHLKALKAFYNWCIDHGLTDRNPFIRRKVIFRKRDRLLTDAEVKTLWHYDHPPYSDIVKLLILTGQRRNQIWRFDPTWCDGTTITFPATIMKTKRPHTIPITGYGWFLQTFNFNSWSKSKQRIDKATGISDWVLHDFRRYFSTTCAKIGVPLHITEQLLDHRTTLSGIAAVYNKYQYIKEMREALEAYERHVQTVVA